MIHRAILNVSRVAVARSARAQILQKVQIRHVHKGHESVAPMRWMSISVSFDSLYFIQYSDYIFLQERLGLYFFIAFAFLSYPTYVLMNLDNLRPKGENVLGEAALEERERRLAARG